MKKDEKENIPFKLLQVEGYMSRFIELSADCNTYKEAYQATEKEFRDTFGVSKYKNYASFRVCKTRFYGSIL